MYRLYGNFFARADVYITGKVPVLLAGRWRSVGVRSRLYSIMEQFRSYYAVVLVLNILALRK